MCLGKGTGEGTFLSKMEIELFRISMETRKKGIGNKGTEGGLTEGLGKKMHAPGTETENLTER